MRVTDTQHNSCVLTRRRMGTKGAQRRKTLNGLGVRRLPRRGAPGLSQCRKQWMQQVY